MIIDNLMLVLIKVMGVFKDEVVCIGMEYLE